MSEAVAFLNNAFAGLLNILVWPFKGLSPVWGLVFVSALAGIVLLYFFGLISNQTAIRKTKQRIHAALLETVLFRHDLRLCLRAQGRMLKGAGVYFILALMPLIVLSIPCIYLLGHLNARYNQREARVGEPIVIGLEAAKGHDLFTLALSAPAGLEQEAVVRVPAENQVVFRVKAAQSGKQKIEIKDSQSGAVYEKPLYIDQRAPTLEPYSFSNFYWSLLYPGGEITGSAKAALKSVWVNYPLREMSFLGMQMHWIVIFLIVSIVSGLVASRYMGIEI